jgi:hypothetical protein
LHDGVLRAATPGFNFLRKFPDIERLFVQQREPGSGRGEDSRLQSKS